MIAKEEEQANTYIKTISKLELRERNMLEKLKKTQTQHAAVAEDLDRINRNLDPTGPLAGLKFGVSGKKSVSIISRASPKKESKKATEVTPQPTPQSQPNTEKINGANYYDRMYGQHQLYDVNSFYR